MGECFNSCVADVPLGEHRFLAKFSRPELTLDFEQGKKMRVFSQASSFASTRESASRLAHYIEESELRPLEARVCGSPRSGLTRACWKKFVLN